MLNQEFDIESVAAVNFGVQLKGAGRFFVPSDDGVQNALIQMLSTTAQSFEQIDAEWEEFSVSEDYGPQRKIFALRGHDLMVDLSALYDGGDFPEAANLPDLVPLVDYYFGVFWDQDDRRVVGVKKAIQFKGTLKARNRLIRVVDDSLRLIDDIVLRLDLEFDIIIANERIYIRKVLPFEYLADIVTRVAGAAAEKIEFIEEQVPFLDLSGISERIGDHARTARLAASIAARDDLQHFQQDYIVEMAEMQGIGFVATDDGRLRPRVVDGHKLLGILDDRRYVTRLTEGGPTPFRAPSRQRVIPDH